MRLSADEQVYLAALAAPARGATPIADEDVLLQAIVEGFPSGPAFVSDMFWNIGVYNALADTVYGFSSANEKNLFVRMLLEPEMRLLHLDWERIGRQMIAIAHMAFADDPKPEIVAPVEWQPAADDDTLRRMRVPTFNPR